MGWRVPEAPITPAAESSALGEGEWGPRCSSAHAAVSCFAFPPRAGLTNTRHHSRCGFEVCSLISVLNLISFCWYQRMLRAWHWLQKPQDVPIRLLHPRRMKQQFPVSKPR